MKSRIVLTKNVAALHDAGEALRLRAPGMPGMGLVHGETGYGKTTAITWMANRANAVYVRALAAWTPAAMFRSILRELGRDVRGGSCADMIETIVEALAMSGRPLYIDEADYLVDSKRMTESLRDIHDMATSPVILVGMGGIDARLSHRKQLTGRVMQDVRFNPLDLEDASTIARELCEIDLAPDLLEHLHRESCGSTRLICVGLARIEQSARSRGLGQISLADWGKRALFTGDAPTANAQAGLRVVR